jgi:glutamyl-tRNA synthetase
MLYKYLGWEDTMPTFAHLPLILRPDGNGKLSKRDGDRLGFPVFPLNWTDPNTGEQSSGYRERGYYSGAFVNMLAFLGWNPGTSQEVFTMEELIEAFSLERVGKAGAKFDDKKTKWFNQQYLKLESDESLTERVAPFSTEKGYDISREDLQQIVHLMRERATFDEDIINEAAFFFGAPESYDEKVVTKRWNKEVSDHLKAIVSQFNETSFDAESLESSFKSYLEAHELGFGKVGQPLRVAITGVAAGPSLFAIMSILGKEEVNSRLKTAVEKLN